MKLEPSLLEQAVLIACNAQDFLTAAKRCGEFDHADYEGRLSDPQIVNCAFAIELALKGLQIIYLGKAEPGHRLDELFKRLPTEVQDKIRRKVDETLFLTNLREVRSAFVEWRYAHEADELTIDYGFLEWMATRTIRMLQKKANLIP